MSQKLFAILIFALLASESVSAANNYFVCYYGTWAYYRTGNGNFPVSKIDTTHCTHLIYTFIGVQTDANNTIVSLDTWLDYDLNNLANFTALKSVRSDLKTLVAIGGWNQGSANFSTVAASATLRASFIQQALEFVQTNGFDGFDFDWEYPAQNGGATEDKANFVTLLKEFRAVFEPLGLLVTAAVAASASSVALSYDVPEISQYLDFINVMTYDLHGSWEAQTAHHAALYAASTEVSDVLNVDACISNWIAQGAPAEKLVLGLPFYGRTFTLTSNDSTGLGAPASGPGEAGPYTLEAGMLAYNEIVEKRNAGGWTYVWLEEQQVPYMYNGNQWCGFDDPTSLAIKVQYALSKGLGGVMVWSIEEDDFNGLSGTTNPLLNSITTALAAASSNTSSSNTTTTTTTTTTAASTTTTSSSSDTSSSNTTAVICTTTGFVRDSTDCSKFYACTLDASGNYIANLFYCATGLYFDTATLACNYPSLVTGCD